MDISLEYYKIFYYVGKTGSITLAADELSISQPAVSQSIKSLERLLGSSLFVRTKKGVRFTKEGEVLYSYVERGYESIRQGERKFREMLNLDVGSIHIGASDMTLQYFLLPWLERFHERYPNIKVTVTNAPTPETLHHLKEGKIDFGAVSSPVSCDREWQVRPVRTIEDIFVAGKNFADFKGKRMNYEALSRLPVMCLEGSTSTRTYVEDFLKERRVILQPEFELATSNMLIQFAIRGLGVACVVEDFALEYIKQGELFRLEFDERIPRREICLVNDERVPMSAAARQLLKMMEKETESMAAGPDKNRSQEKGWVE